MTIDIPNQLSKIDFRIGFKILLLIFFPLIKTISFTTLAFDNLLVKFTFMFIFLKYLIDIVVYLLK